MQANKNPALCEKEDFKAWFFKCISRKFRITLLGSPQDGQATLHLSQKHLLCWEYTVYRNVMLCLYIKPPAQLTNHARLDTHSNECMYFLFTEFLWVEPNTVPAINTKWDRNWLFIYLLNKVVWIAIHTTPICPSVQIKCRPQWVYTLLSYYFKINFNIIFPSISWSFKQCLTFWISDQNPVCTSLFPPWMSYALPSTSSLIWSPQYLAGTKNHDAPHVSMGFHHCVNEIFTLLGCCTV